MTYFITGSSGVIGTHLVDRLRASTAEPVVCLNGDIRERGSVARQVAAAGRIRQVVHLAALVPVREVEASPATAYAVNVGGTINLMEAVAELAAPPSVFYASTSHVYAPQSEPLREADPVAPRNLYATTKYLGEQVVADIGARIGSPVCVGRMFSFYDATQNRAFLYPAIMNRLASEDLTQPFELHGANSVRDFSTAKAIADAALGLMQRQATGVVNIGSGTGVTIAEFVQRYSTVPLDIVPRGGAETLVANVDLLESILGRLTKGGTPDGS